MAELNDWEDVPSAPDAGGADDWEDVAAPEGPSNLEAGTRGLAQGASLGFADEITGGAEALWDQLKGSNTPFAEAYRKHRDESRANYDAAEKAAPEVYGGAKLAGSIASGLGAAAATGGTSLLAQGALSAGMGAANALGGAKELDEDAAKAALIEGGVGGLLGAGGGAIAAKLGQGAASAARGAANKLDDIAISQGRRVLTGGAGGSATEPLAEDAVRLALASGAIKAGRTTEDAAKNLAMQRDAVGELYGRVLKGLEAEGFEAADAAPIAKRWMDRMAQESRVNLDDAIPNEFGSKANKLLGAPEDLSLSEMEAMRRNLDKSAKWDLLKDNSLNKARMEMASDLRAANEAAIESQAALATSEGAKKLAAQYEASKGALNKIIPASDAANKAAAQAAKRREFSLSDNMLGAAGFAGSLASGNPLAAVKGAGAAVANNLLRNRGTSAVAVGAHKLAPVLGKVANVLETNPARLGKYAGVLASAAERGPDALNAAQFVLGNSDPEYQELVKTLDDEPGP